MVPDTRRKEYFLLPMLMVMVINSTSYVSWQGEGLVRMQGAIVDTPCAIEMSSREQNIDMGEIPVSQIIRDGKGLTRPFSIQLINCVTARANLALPDWQSFQVTFDGFNQNRLFSVQGEAKGVALKIIDYKGMSIIPGKALPKRLLQTDSMLLNFSMILVSNQQQLKAGQYFATIRFKLDYF